MSIYLKDDGSDKISQWNGFEGKAFVGVHIYDVGSMEWIPWDGAGTGGGGGDATAANQTLQLDELVKLTAEEIVMIDNTSDPNITYIGFAAIGTDGATALWKIFYLDKTSGLAKLYADGTAAYVNVWDDRVSYTYS